LTGRSRTVSVPELPPELATGLWKGAQWRLTTTRRKTDDELSEDSIEELKTRRNDKRSSSVDVDETEQAEGFELPGADLSGEEMSVRVIPRQADEFTCSRCFLVHHRSQLASEKNGQMICSECAA